MDSRAWDERYSGRDLVWSRDANVFVQEIAGAMAPGTALDVAAGEGRNAIWLVERGWTVHASDFSPVAVERTAALADARLNSEKRTRLTTSVADATAPPADDVQYGLVLLSYLQLPLDPWKQALESAAAQVLPGGHLMVVIHAAHNLAHGVGGPQDTTVLHDPQDVVTAAHSLPLTVESAQLRTREVEVDGTPRKAYDAVVVFRKN